MAPIHDTDVAEERWAKAEWQHYELWEKVEVRLQRRKWLWIVGTVCVFVLLSSVPILIDRWPKWTAAHYSRKLAQEISYLKRSAALENAAFRIRFESPTGLTYVIERAKSCGASEFNFVRTGALAAENSGKDYLLLDADEGSKLGVPGLVNSFCYDPLEGAKEPALVSGFGIIPASDFGDSPRMDRLSILLVSGPSAELAFE